MPPPVTLVSCSAYSSALKIVATCYPEPSVDFQRTTQRYIQENRTLHNGLYTIIVYGWLHEFTPLDLDIASSSLSSCSQTVIPVLNSHIYSIFSKIFLSLSRYQHAFGSFCNICFDILSLLFHSYLLFS
jgi:hypothetical protein